MGGVVVLEGIHQGFGLGCGKRGPTGAGEGDRGGRRGHGHAVGIGDPTKSEGARGGIGEGAAQARDGAAGGGAADQQLLAAAIGEIGSGVGNLDVVEGSVVNIGEVVATSGEEDWRPVFSEGALEVIAGSCCRRCGVDRGSGLISGGCERNC